MALSPQTHRLCVLCPHTQLAQSPTLRLLPTNQALACSSCCPLFNELCFIVKLAELRSGEPLDMILSYSGAQTV